MIRALAASLLLVAATGCASSVPAVEKPLGRVMDLTSVQAFAAPGGAFRLHVTHEDFTTEELLWRPHGAATQEGLDGDVAPAPPSDDALAIAPTYDRRPEKGLWYDAADRRFRLVRDGRTFQGPQIAGRVRRDPYWLIPIAIGALAVALPVDLAIETAILPFSITGVLLREYAPPSPWK